VARKSKGEEAKGDAFTVMFTSLSMILLAFFILLNSMATIDSKKIRKALGSLTSVFSGSGSGPLVQFGDDIITIGEELGLRADGPGKLAKKIIDKQLSDEGVTEQVVYEIDGDDVLLVFSDHICFDSGQAHLKPIMDKILETIAGVIVHTRAPTVVEGHTDSNPISTAIFPSNWELSTARAGAVARHLIEKLNIDPDEISCEGHGEFKPVADNATPEGRAANRRVVIRFKGLAAEEKGKKKDDKKNPDPFKDLGL